jgi:hypothetical protein
VPADCLQVSPDALTERTISPKRIGHAAYLVATAIWAACVGLVFGLSDILPDSRITPASALPIRCTTATCSPRRGRRLEARRPGAVSYGTRAATRGPVGCHG